MTVRRLDRSGDGEPSDPARQDIGPEDPDSLRLLSHGQMGPCLLTPSGSNYTFMTSLSLDGKRCRAVYKPRQGEAPLWDFPDGTLYKREYAAYVLGQALRWNFVPGTIIRDGEYGVGSVQLFIPPEPGSSYFTVRETHPGDVRRMAIFDLVANNADRKAGHCFKGVDGRIWSIDHGLTFHHAPKLRTVIWDFAQDPIPQDLLEDLEQLASELDRRGPDVAQLSALLASREMAGLRERIEVVLEARHFPAPSSHRDVPWPWM